MAALVYILSLLKRNLLFLNRVDFSLVSFFHFPDWDENCYWMCKKKRQGQYLTNWKISEKISTVFYCYKHLIIKHDYYLIVVCMIAFDLLFFLENCGPQIQKTAWTNFTVNWPLKIKVNRIFINVIKNVCFRVYLMLPSQC